MGASLLEFHVLLALASGTLHGYAIAERIAADGPCRILDLGAGHGQMTARSATASRCRSCG